MMLLGDVTTVYELGAPADETAPVGAPAPYKSTLGTDTGDASPPAALPVSGLEATKPAAVLSSSDAPTIPSRGVSQLGGMLVVFLGLLWLLYLSRRW